MKKKEDCFFFLLFSLKIFSLEEDKINSMSVKVVIGFSDEERYIIIGDALTRSKNMGQVFCLYESDNQEKEQKIADSIGHDMVNFHWSAFFWREKAGLFQKNDIFIIDSHTITKIKERNLVKLVQKFFNNHHLIICINGKQSRYFRWDWIQYVSSILITFSQKHGSNYFQSTFEKMKLEHFWHHYHSALLNQKHFLTANEEKQYLIKDVTDIVSVYIGSWSSCDYYELSLL